jgi:hypothetical protein
MNYLKTYQIFEANVTNPIEIIKNLNRDKNAKYTLNKDNSIDVEGNVNISYLSLTEMPVKFGKINGDFDCSNNFLKSLENAPTIVTGYFDCSSNELTSLKGCPTTVSGEFNCSSNELTSLEHCPTTITGYFYCSYNLLTSLEHCPINVTGNFDCSYNQLTSLKHCPTTILAGFSCSNNLLTSLEHGPKTVSRRFNLSYNEFPENIQKKIDNFEGTWQELMALNVIWQSKKLNDLDNKTGLFN